MKAKLIFNPFERVAGFPALLSGWGFMLLTAGLAIPSGLRFDGVLDAHFYPGSEWWRPFADQAVNWLVLVVVFTLAALLFGRSKFRLVDVAGTLALARAPMLLASLAGLPGVVSSFFIETPRLDTNTLLTMPAFWITVVLALLMIWATVWSAILIFNAWSITANVKGTRAGVVYAFGLAVAEIGSKILIAHS